MTLSVFRCFACLVIAILACSFSFIDSSHLAASGQQSNAAPKPYSYGPFALGGTEYTVTMQDAVVAPPMSGKTSPQKENTDTTLAYIFVQDGKGTKVWERKFEIRDSATETRTIGTAYEVQGQTGEGIVIEVGRICPKQVTTGAFTILAQRNGHLQQIAPEVRFYGMMEHIPDAGRDRRHLISGDVIRYQFWTGNYYLLRGVRVDLTARTVTPLCTHKCTFSIMPKENPVVETDAKVQLFDVPFGKPHDFLVRKQSEIKLLNAYVEEATEYSTVDGGNDERPWLHIDVDGESGWISDPIDLQKIGLLSIAHSDGII